MKYSPSCHAEYFDYKERCDDCSTGLISEEQYRAFQKDREEFLKETKRFKKIFVLADRFEGDLITDALKKERIPTIVREYKDTAYNGIYIPQKGWGCVMVPEKWEKKATQIISELEHAFESKETASTGDGESWICSACGQEATQGDLRCPHCGASFEDET